MKSIFKTTCLFLMGSMLTLTGMSQHMPEAVSLRQIKLAEGSAGLSYHNDISRMNRALQQHSKGLSVGLWVGDRGARKGQMTHVWGFELKANRDYYFPSADAESYPQLGALLAEIGMNIAMDDPRVESGLNVYTDYVVIGYHDLVNPMSGEVVAEREIEVKPGKEEAFEAFVKSDVHPAGQKYIEGMSMYVLKGDRGERKGKYLMIYCFDTLARRDAYFPTEGEGGSEAYTQAAEGMPDLSAKWNEFLVEGSGDTYTDYMYIE